MTVRHWHWLAGFGLVTAAFGGGCGAAGDGVSLGDDGRALGGAGAAPVAPVTPPDEGGDPPAGAGEGAERPVAPAREDGPPGPPDAEGCTTLINAEGLLCRTCPGEGGPATECLPCQSGVADRCLTCVDPKGHEAIDCSDDYEILPTASIAYAGGGSFNSCHTSWGTPGFSDTTCHYPGPGSCSTTESDDARCVTCSLPGGVGGSSCLYDPNDPLPDPLAGRPADLPPPGECVTETDLAAPMICTTCTRADGSATKSCRHPETAWCDIVPATGYTACVACAGGGQDRRILFFCDAAVGEADEG